MNFYEAVSNLLEEMRCDSEEREYTVETEEWKTAGKSLKQIQKRLPSHLEKMSEREQDFWKKYLDQLEHFSLCRGAEGLLPGYDGWDRIPQQHRSNKEKYECKKDDR